jgi:hypothetical protein
MSNPNDPLGHTHNIYQTICLVAVIWPFILVGGLFWFVDTVKTAALEREAKRAELYARAHTPAGRDIPRCDKELWLRIKDGCNDT